MMSNIILTNVAPLTSITAYNGRARQTYTADIYGTIIIPEPQEYLEFDPEDTISMTLATLDFDFNNRLSDYQDWEGFKRYSTVTVNAVKENNLYNANVWKNSNYVDPETHVFDYLKYLNDNNGQVGEVQYIYIRKRQLAPEDTAIVSYSVLLSSYNQDITEIVTQQGRVYRNCGTLSEFKCGNGFDIDISYLKQTIN